jgi:hypothetical protein
MNAISYFQNGIEICILKASGEYSLHQLHLPVSGGLHPQRYFERVMKLHLRPFGRKKHLKVYVHKIVIRKGVFRETSLIRLPIFLSPDKKS